MILSTQTPSAPWQRVTVVEQTESTNSDLAQAARSGAGTGEVLVAWEQTVGRGRLDRSWSSPPGTSVSLSFLVRPGQPQEQWGLLPLVTGLGVADALDGLGVAAVLKWPNDVLLPADKERKVCGILAEGVGGPEPGVVVGLGVNVHQRRDQLPVDTATSLHLAGLEVSREQVVRAVLDGIGAAYLAWEADGWAAVGPRYRRRCVTIGRQVRVLLPGDQQVAGEVVSVLDDGRIQLRTGGRLVAYAAGDVQHVRAGLSGR
ncbi:MAG: biotin--[acetyl-CoA-carboxylase] ligase [Actinomycetia bacterium]|nr:biotin--[acetyl-CoA-carboxylase] ligase [Actinomycetes bacterium]